MTYTWITLLEWNAVVVLRKQGVAPRHAFCGGGVGARRGSAVRGVEPGSDRGLVCALRHRRHQSQGDLLVAATRSRIGHFEGDTVIGFGTQREVSAR